MLLVIVIIAVLAAISSISFQAARNHAKRARAETQLRELVKAWAVYYQTYQKWPASNPNLNDRSDVEMSYDNLLPLFATRDDGSANPNNTNSIPFLAIKIAPGETYCDPWGHPYKVTFKSGKDEMDVMQQIAVSFPNRDRYR